MKTMITCVLETLVTCVILAVFMTVMYFVTNNSWALAVVAVLYFFNVVDSILKALVFITFTVLLSVLTNDVMTSLLVSSFGFFVWFNLEVTYHNWFKGRGFLIPRRIKNEEGTTPGNCSNCQDQTP